MTPMQNIATYVLLENIYSASLLQNNVQSGNIMKMSYNT